MIDPIIQGSFNIYFFPNISGGAKGVTFNVPGNACVISYNSTLLSTLAHEAGHCFGLYHTDEICNGYENVVRISNQTCSANCDIAGDKVCDTPAQRNANGSSTDNCGTSYPTSNPNEGNIMDIQTGDGARYFFTFGQKQRMEYYLQNYLNYLIFKVNITASNKIGNINQVGSKLHIDGELINSGENKDLLYGRLHLSRTDKEIISTNYKHHDWDDDYSQFRLTESFDIDLNNLNRDANFIQINTVNIKNILTEVFSSNLGTKQIKDPWWVDQNGNQPDAFRNLTTSSTSVFLNQSFTNPVYYSVNVTSPQPIFLSQTGKTHNFYFQNWSGTDATFQNANAASTGVVFTSGTAVVNANLKGTQLSNNINAYANNGQSKFVRTDNGYLHLVYESIGRVWYERSTNNGSTWEIMNNEKPLDVNGGKLPSIDYRGNTIGIVWQEIEFGSSKIQIDCFGGTVPYSGYPKIVFSDPSQPYSNNLNPVIAWDYNGRAIVAWENKSNSMYPIGIIAKYGPLSQFAYLGSPNWDGWDTEAIPSTNLNSINPAIDVVKVSQSTIYFQIAWEQNNSQYSHYINYCKVYADGSNNIQNTAIQNISNGNNKIWNYNPSIIAWPDGSARVNWISDTDGFDNTFSTFRDPGTSRFWNFGYKVRSSIINKSDDYTSYFIAWSDQYSTYNKFTDNYTLQDIRNLNTTGKALQLSNGATRDYMYVSSFMKNTLPYFFTMSNSIGSYYVPSKINNPLVMNVGRGATLTKGEVQFYFTIDGIKLNEESIYFVEAPKNTSINSNEDIINIWKPKHLLLMAKVSSV